MHTNNHDTNYATILGARTKAHLAPVQTQYTTGTINKPSWQEMLIIITFVRFSSCSKYLITIKKLRRHFALVACTESVTDIGT